jgi:hypothetical protein
MAEKEKAALSPELQAIANQAAAVDGVAAAAVVGADAGQVEEGAGAPSDPVGETAAVVGLVFAGVAKYRPYLSAVLNDEAAAELAALYVPVAQKYGWAVGGGIAGQYGPELMLGFGVFGLVMGVKNAHVDYVAALPHEAEGEAVAAQ